jgi:hypothetical protein
VRGTFSLISGVGNGYGEWTDVWVEGEEEVRMDKS